MRGTSTVRLALLCSIVRFASAVSTVKVTGTKARLFKAGHPLVFAGAVGSVQQEPEAGGVVDVVDGKGDLIGWGVWNPHSMFRVRVLAHVSEEVSHRSLDILLQQRLQQAWACRAAFGLPSKDTSAFRLVNSEGDRISGLTVDVFGTIAVAVSSALWIELQQEVVTDALLQLEGINQVIWRRSDARLKQDGWESPGEMEHLSSSPPEKRQVEIRENGLRYLVSPTLGQKSGFYCDQVLA